MKHFFALSLFFCSLSNLKSIVNTSPESFLNYQVRNQDSIKLVNMESRIKKFAQQKKYDSAIFYSKKLLSFSAKNLDSINMAKSNFRLGYYSKKQGKLDDAFFYLNNSFKIHRDLDDSISAASRLLSMAIIQKNFGDFTGSKTTTIDGLKYLENSLELVGLFGLYQNISVCFREQRNFERALEYNTKALALENNSLLFEKIKRIDFLKLKNTRSNILANQQNFEKSISILKNILLDSIILKNKKEYARVLSNLGYIEWLRNIKNLKSDSLLNKALTIRTEINDKQGLIASNIHLTKFYFDKDKEKALKYAEAAYENAQKRNSLPSIIEALGYVFQLKKNTSIEAIVYHKANKKLKDINQKNRDVYAVTKFENEKLIIVNAKKDKQVLEEKNRNDNLRAITLLTILCLLFLIIYIGQRTKNLKQKNEQDKLKEVYKTEAKLSRKLHDDFGGKLNHAMLLLQSDANNEKVLNIVDGLYNQSRDFSREINDVDTGPNFKNFLFGMMGNYCKNKKLITTGSTEVNWLKLSPLSKKTLFKVLQELMINMQKHSNASLVSVSFEQSKKTLKISYLDNGVGASKEELDIKNGLWNTEKRIKAIGGTIIFDSEKENGFEAQIEIPN